MTSPLDDSPPRPDALDYLRLRYGSREGVAVDGSIVTGIAYRYIPAAFEALLATATRYVQDCSAEASLYLYGSVATGAATPGVSDVDLVAVGLKASVAGEIGQRLSSEYRHLCRGVAVGAAHVADYEGESDQAYGNRVFLRHYCLHLAGPKVRQVDLRFPADARAARGFNGDIGICINRWRTEGEAQTSPELLARRVARKTLFALAALVSVTDASWTTHRRLSAERWGALRPADTYEVHRLLLWGDGQDLAVSRTEIQQALYGFVAAVAAEFEKRIGRWDSVRALG